MSDDQAYEEVFGDFRSLYEILVDLVPFFPRDQQYNFRSLYEIQHRTSGMDRKDWLANFRSLYEILIEVKYSRFGGAIIISVLSMRFLSREEG